MKLIGLSRHSASATAASAACWLVAVMLTLSCFAERSVAESSDLSAAMKAYIVEAVLGSPDVEDWDRLPFFPLKDGKLRLTFVEELNGEDKQAIESLRSAMRVQAEATNLLNKSELISVQASASESGHPLSSTLVAFVGGPSQFEAYKRFLDDQKKQPLMLAAKYYPLGSVEPYVKDACVTAFFLTEHEIVGGAVYVQADEHSFYQKETRANESRCVSNAILSAFGFRGSVHSLPNCDSVRCVNSPAPAFGIIDMHAIGALYTTGAAADYWPANIMKELHIDTY